MKFSVLICVVLSSVWATPPGQGKHVEKILPNDRHMGIRIIGGDIARAGQFPFAAAIQVKTSDSTFFCGGALINTQWILTAAHCVQNAIEFTIIVGSATLTGDDPNRVTVIAHEYYLHDEFNSTTLENDIGLIRLLARIQFSDYIGKIHLPIESYGPNVAVTAIGWGQVNDTLLAPVDHLNCVKLETISNDNCRIFYGMQITDDMICANGQYNEGTCTGDSGGPLIYFLNAQHPIHVGVSSFISGHGCESVEPSGYTRTYPYLDWISSVTESVIND
jgi:secreted trypsin-like serine protease